MRHPKSPVHRQHSPGRSPSPSRDREPAHRFLAIMANTPRLVHLVWQAAPGLLLLSLGLTLMGALLPIAQLYVNKLIVDGVIRAVTEARPSLPTVMGLVAVGFGLTLMQAGLTQGTGYVTQVLGDRFTLYANQILLNQALRLDLAHYERPEFYDLLNRAQQSGSTYPVKVLTHLTTLLGQGLTGLGLLLVLMRFSPILVLLLLVTSLPTFWVGINFSNRRFALMRRQTQSARWADYFQKILLGQSFVKEVRLFNLGGYLLGRWRTIRTAFNQETARLAAQQSVRRFGVGVVATGGFYSAYAWVVVQAVRGAITVGDLSLYGGAFQQSQTLVQAMLSNLSTIYEQNLYVSQFFEFLAIQPFIVSPVQAKAFPVPMRQGLELRQVTFTYPGAREPTLHQVTLSVRPGESIALVGTNGAGKTTLLKLLTRFYDLDDGEILIDGIPLQAFDLPTLRRNIGVVFQDFARYNLSAQENIGFGDLSQLHNLPRIKQAARDAGAARLIKQLDHRYQTILGKTFPDSAELSGGQWQRIGLSRAFMAPAQILILDEPTAALDAIAEADLFHRFRQLTAGKMTFLVSHRFSTVRMADRIVVLEQGRVTEVGSHAELMAQGGLYAHLFRLQAESYGR